MKSPWLIVSACTAAFLGGQSAIALVGDHPPQPVKDIVPALEKDIAAHPDNPALVYELGRVHQLAAAYGYESLFRYLNVPYVPGSFDVYDLPGALADYSNATLGADDRKAHLLAAIAAYRKALALTPKDKPQLPIARLRLAIVLEKAGAMAIEWKIESPTTQPAPSTRPARSGQAVPAVAPAVAELAQIEQEVKQLGDAEFDARIAAAAALARHIEAALPTLKAHRQDADVEIRTHVAALIDFATRKPWYDQAANQYRAVLAVLEAPKPGGPVGKNLILITNNKPWRLDPGQLQDDGARCVYQAAEGLVRLLDATPSTSSGQGTPPARENERAQAQAIADLMAQQFNAKPDPVPPPPVITPDGKGNWRMQ